MCMLNVGQALKNERLAQNKTQREWIKIFISLCLGTLKLKMALLKTVKKQI